MISGGSAPQRTQNLVKNATSRDPRQLWIARGMEPTASGRDFMKNERFKDWFNFTATLSLKATFRESYFSIVDKRHKKFNNMSEIEQAYNSFGKDKDFCWMVTACYTFNKRFEDATDIMNRLPGNIHMWGYAIDRGCMSKLNRSLVVNHGFSRRSKEAGSEIPKCKFYFSFENSNCTEYITEKFSNALANYAIPIVNGWRDSYERALPGSFIHISDFANAAQLAEYLSGLLANKKEFFKYHEWRLKYEVLPEERGTQMYNLLHCQVCQKVFETREANKESMTRIERISNISDHFRSIQKCRPR